MHPFKLLLLALFAVVALLGGFLVAAAIAGGAAMAGLVRRFFLRSNAVQLTPRAASPGRTAKSNLDVIDVEATEVVTSSHRP